MKYGNCNHLSRLQHTQNSLARAVVKALNFSHHSYSQISPLAKVNERVEYKILFLTYKTLLLNQLISITWYLFSLLAALVRHLSSRSLVHPHLPLLKSQISFQYASPSLWNNLHSVNLVHHLSPPSHHPSLLKTHMFQKSFPHRSSPTHRTATGLQPDCIHGLRPTQRYVLVLSLSFLVDACVGLNWLLALAFSQFLITRK